MEIILEKLHHFLQASPSPATFFFLTYFQFFGIDTNLLCITYIDQLVDDRDGLEKLATIRLASNRDMEDERPYNLIEQIMNRLCTNSHNRLNNMFQETKDVIR